MQVIGLLKNPKVLRYLKEVYELDGFMFENVPALRKGESFFLGGFKGFYSVLVDEEGEFVEHVIRRFFTIYREAFCLFSVSNTRVKSDRMHYLLRVSKDISLDGRFRLYGKKTRNQVRKSYLNRLRLEIGHPPKDFYDLYVASMKRLKSIPRTHGYFERLEEILGESIVCISVFDGDILVGCNYVILSDNYVALLFNVSDSTYWSLNINDRLYDELICWAISHNIEFIDFGPSIHSDVGHNHFKEGFGAIPRSIVEEKQVNVLISIRLFFAQKARNARLFLRKLA